MLEPQIGTIPQECHPRRKPKVSSFAVRSLCYISNRSDAQATVSLATSCGCKHSAMKDSRPESISQHPASSDEAPHVSGARHSPGKVASEIHDFFFDCCEKGERFPTLPGSVPKASRNEDAHLGSMAPAESAPASRYNVVEDPDTPSSKRSPMSARRIHHLPSQAHFNCREGMVFFDTQKVNLARRPAFHRARLPVARNVDEIKTMSI